MTLYNRIEKAISDEVRAEGVDFFDSHVADKVLDIAAKELAAILNDRESGYNKQALLEGWAIKWFNYKYTGEVFDPVIYRVQLTYLEQFLKGKFTEGLV